MSDFSTPFGPQGGNAWYPTSPKGKPIDAYGNYVPDTTQRYVSMIVNYGFGPQYTYVDNPNYNPVIQSSAPQTVSAPAPAPPQYQATFDTIGQTIYRMIGHVRVPLRIIWAQGLNASGDTTISPTLTFAAALGAPFDPDEVGSVVVIFAGSSAIYDPSAGGVVVPDTVSAADAALLQASLAAAVVYPGNEAQLPDPMILADKGANVTNAFRGIRYIVFPAFPLSVTGGIPNNLSVTWQRTNALVSYLPAAVEFAAGTG
jgi:hypothetical protein